MENKLVIITGAAGGIGTATVTKYLELGYTVVGIDITPSTTTHSNYHHITTDITDPEKIIKAVKQAVTFGTLQHAIAIAGGALPEEINNTDIINIPAETITNSITLNLTAQLYYAQAVLPYLRQTPNSTLTFTSSINGTHGIGLHPYSAAKAGILSLARTLATSEGKHNIRVNTVTPGTAITPRTQKEWANHPEHFNEMNQSTTLNRTTTVEEIANTFTTITETLTALTGQTITVDAGQTARWR